MIMQDLPKIICMPKSNVNYIEHKCSLKFHMKCNKTIKISKFTRKLILKIKAIEDN